MTMQVNISGQHVEVTPALHKYVMEKLQKVEKHFNHITNVNVTLEVDKKFQQKISAHALLSHGELYASSESDDLYKAIDDMVAKLSRQAQEHKDKLQKRSED